LDALFCSHDTVPSQSLPGEACRVWLSRLIKEICFEGVIYGVERGVQKKDGLR